MSKPDKERILQIQRHPYPPFIPLGAKALILGSAPPARFCADSPKPLKGRDMDWYYGSFDRGPNLLWEILFRVLDPTGLTELDRIRNLQSAREDRTSNQRRFLQNWLSARNLGMADILLRFERLDGSAADAKLRVLEFNDLISFLRLNPAVQAIFCTSRHRVFEWFCQYLDAQRIVCHAHTDGYGFRLPPSGEARENSTPIRVFVLPSPSPIGRIRFPSHQAWLSDLVSEYRRIFSLAGISNSESP